MHEGILTGTIEPINYVLFFTPYVKQWLLFVQKIEREIPLPFLHNHASQSVISKEEFYNLSVYTSLRLLVN